jgi:hypothetical protein
MSGRDRQTRAGCGVRQLEVQDLASLGTFTATGLNFADYFAFTAVMINTTYK